MNVFEAHPQLLALDGTPLDTSQLGSKAVLVVNVASKCGLTPQYAGLERLQQRYGGGSFTVLGTPCNQFAGQEPGTAEEIGTFCATTYGTTFPITAKLEVNGRHRDPLFEALCALPDLEGRAGEVEWNFEKFLVGVGGEPLARFRPQVEPESEMLVDAIERAIADAQQRTWATVPAREVAVGDRIRPQPGLELTVTRIDVDFFGRDGLLAFVEDSETRWLKVPCPADTEVELLRAATPAEGAAR